jgi:outer membrane receptor protein involved in Fe transport
VGQVPEYIQGAATLNCFPNAAGVATYFCGKLVPDPKQIRLNLNLVGNGFQNTDQTRVILEADWQLGDAVSLTATSTYAKQQSDTFCDCDYSGSVSLGGAFHSLFASEIENKSQELRLQSSASRPLRWMVGGYVFTEDSNSFRANAATIVIPFVTVNNKAVFGSLEFDLTDALTVNVDARYQRERQTRSAIPGNPAIDVVYKAFLPRAIVEFKPSDELMFYASAAKGNQPGQFNTGSNIPADLVKVDSESLWSYEAGIKTQLLDRRLQLALAAYRIDWDNQVYRSERVGTDGRIVNILANLGASRIKGLELEASAALAPGLTLNGTFAFIDSRYRDFLSPNALRVYRNAQVAGQRLPNTPRYQGSLSLAYERPVAEDASVFVRGDYSYRGRQFVSEINQAYIDDLHLVNLSAGVEMGGLRLGVRVDNLLNSDVPEFATRFTDLNSPGLSRFGYLIKLRSSRAISASLRYAF